MTDNRYAYAMTQLEIQGVLHPDAHMFAQEYLYQTKPKVVIETMTMLSLKDGLKEWGDKAHSSDKSGMKQLHLRNTFITMYRHDLTYKEIQMVLESHMLLNQKRDGNIKGRTLSGSNK